MNEWYLSKAKRTDNGEWIRGYYNKELNGDEFINCDDGFEYDSEPMLIYVEIDSNTLCQCTSCNAKNGLIYENDRVKSTISNIEGVVIQGYYIDSNINEMYSAYYQLVNGKMTCSYGFYVIFSDKSVYSLDSNTEYWLEVIGNIHDKEVTNGE